MSTAARKFGSDRSRGPTWVCSRWAIATILGASSAIFPSLIMAVSFPHIAESLDFESASVFATFLGVSIGQWLVLRSFLASMWKWVPVTTLFGFATAGWVTLAIGYGGVDVSEGAWNVFIGLALGVAPLLVPLQTLLLGVPQWLVLRKKLPHSGWWLLATAIGSILTAPGMSALVLLHFDSRIETLLLVYATIILAWTAMAIPQGYALGRLVAEQKSGILSEPADLATKKNAARKARNWFIGIVALGVLLPWLSQFLTWFAFWALGRYPEARAQILPWITAENGSLLATRDFWVLWGLQAWPFVAYAIFAFWLFVAARRYPRLTEWSVAGGTFGMSAYFLCLWALHVYNVGKSWIVTWLESPQEREMYGVLFCVELLTAAEIGMAAGAILSYVLKEWPPWRHRNA